MRRETLVASAAALLLVVLFLVAGVRGASLSQARGATPTLHVQTLNALGYNGVFVQQNVPIDGKSVVTIAGLPFTVSGSNGQIQVTTMNDLEIEAASYGNVGSTANIAQLVCELKLDGNDIDAFVRSWHTLPIDRMVAMTITAPVGIGNHGLGLQCSGWIAAAYAGNTPNGNGNIQMSMGGMTAIVTFVA